MKKIFYVILIVVTFIIASPIIANAEEWTNVKPNLTTLDLLLDNGQNQYSEGQPILANSYGIQGWANHSGYPGYANFGPTPISMSWRYQNDLCVGQDFTFSGQIWPVGEVGRHAFQQITNPEVYLITDYGQISCSAHIESPINDDVQFIQFTCSGASTSVKQIVLASMPTSPNDRLNFMLRSDYSDYSCDVSNGTLNNSIISGNQNIINNQNQNTQDIINNQNQNQQETNDRLDDLNDAITDPSSPDLGGLGDSAGWLPPGPVDSIINLPFSLFNNLNDNLSKSCQPVNLPLPFVDKTIQLPCLNTIYEQIDGLSVWINTIGTIAAGFILYNYFIKLYKWVDDTLNFRENTWQDWGGV